MKCNSGTCFIAIHCNLVERSNAQDEFEKPVEGKKFVEYEVVKNQGLDSDDRMDSRNMAKSWMFNLEVALYTHLSALLKQPHTL